MKTRSKIFRDIELIAFVFFLSIAAMICFGCSGSGDDDKPSSTDVANGDGDEAPAIASSFVTVEEGGLVYIAHRDHELNGASIDIPPLAVDHDTKISFGVQESLPDDSPYGQTPLGKIFILEPSGTRFDEDVTLTLPIPGANVDAPLYIGRWNESKKWWESLGGTVDGDFISTAIGHLSMYAVFYKGKSNVQIVNAADPTLADLGVGVTYESGPAIFSDILDEETFPAYRSFPEIEALLQNGELINLALLPGRYRFMISYPHPQPGRGNNLYFTIPVLNTGADDGQIDQTITITMDGATSTDVYTDTSIVFPGYTTDTAENLRPVINTCNAIVPAGVPVVDAQTGSAPTTTTHVVNVGPIKSEQVASGAINLSGRVTDPENHSYLDVFWTDGNAFSYYPAVPGETVTYEFEREKSGRHTVYLTLYDEYDLFDQCQWNITVAPNAVPFVDVVVDDTVVDFGRLDSLRRNNGAVPVPGGLPNFHPDPFFLLLGSGIPNWGVYATPPLAGQLPPAIQGNPTAATDLKRVATIPPGHFNPTQYPGGMTMVYAIVADADGDPINAGFVLPEPIMGKGNLFAAITAPGVPVGTLIDSYATLAAYNAELSRLANLGVLSNQPHQINPAMPLPYNPPAAGTFAASVEPTEITVYPNDDVDAGVTIIREPREFPYVVAFSNGDSEISPGDIVTEAANPLSLIPQGKVHKVLVKQGSWGDGDAKGYLWMIPVVNDFWDGRHDGLNLPILYVNNERVAMVSFVGQALPIIWEAPDDPDVEQETHDRRHIDPNVIPAGGKLNIEARVTDDIGPQQRAFAWVAWPDDKETHCHDVDGDGFFFESACDTELDCDDENAEIHPAADEICDDRIDNDCDEMTDCDDAECLDNRTCTCLDNDADGYFAESECGTEVDCDDDDSAVNPGAVEICDDGMDNDCDGDRDCNDGDCTDDPFCTQTSQVWRLVETTVLSDGYESTREGICLGEGSDGEIITLSGSSITAHWYSFSQYCGNHFDINGTITFDTPPETVAPGATVTLNTSGIQSGYQDCCSLILWFNYYTDAGEISVSPEYVQLNLQTLPITQVSYPDDGTTRDGWQGTVTDQAATSFTFPEAYENDFWCSGRGNRGVGYAWHYQLQE